MWQLAFVYVNVYSFYFTGLVSSVVFLQVLTI